MSLKVTVPSRIAAGLGWPRLARWSRSLGWPGGQHVPRETTDARGLTAGDDTDPSAVGTSEYADAIIETLGS